MIQLPIDRIVYEELEADVVLGGAEEPESLVLQCADQPIGIQLRSIFRELGAPVPSECSLYRMFDVWLIPHRVSILRRGGLAEPVSVGLSIEYEHEDKTCSVISLIPDHQFLTLGHLSVAGGFEGSMSVTGETQPAEQVGRLGATKSLGALRVGITASGRLGFQLSATVFSPVVAAVGKGSARCEWLFYKHDQALYNRDLETWTVLALPKNQPEISYRLKSYYTKRTLFFATRRETKPVLITCKLAV